MKKLFVIALAVLCLMLSTVGAWAEADLSARVEPGIELQYVYVSIPTVTLTISNDGVASCKMSIPIKPGKSIDYGNVTAYLKKNMGTTIKTFTDKVYPSAGKLTWKDTYDLQSKGSYYVEVEVKCYKDGKLVEIVKEQSDAKMY